MDAKELKNDIRNLIRESLANEKDKERVKIFLTEMMKSKEAWIEFISNVMGQVPEYLAERVSDKDFEQFKKTVMDEL